MTKIPYTYEVVAVSDQNIEVMFNNPDHGEMLVGVRRPFEGETLDEVVAQYSPAFWWEEKMKPLAEVAVGSRGQGETLTEPGVEPEPVFTPEEELQFERERMICSRLQGRLVLGEATCAVLDAMAIDPETPWAIRQTILHAIEWQRTSQSMDELAYLLGYEPLQMDNLFRVAMTLRV